MKRPGSSRSPSRPTSRSARSTTFSPAASRSWPPRRSGTPIQEFADILREALATEVDPAEAMIAVTQVLAKYLRDSDWLDGCPITATALETAGRIPDIQRAVVEAFERWRALVAEKLRHTGIAEDDILDLAHTVINTLEGAELAAQVSRSPEPLEIAGRHLARLIKGSADSRRGAEREAGVRHPTVVPDVRIAGTRTSVARQRSAGSRPTNLDGYRRVTLWQGLRCLSV